MDDTISRQATIDALNKKRIETMEKGKDVNLIWECLDAVAQVPSVERKKGRWINHRNDNGHNIADCSECGNAIQWFDGDEKPKFCCMCGADMRGEQDVKVR